MSSEKSGEKQSPPSSNPSTLSPQEAQFAAALQAMLAQMETNLAAMQTNVLSKLDEMTGRIEALEVHLGAVMEAQGIDKAQIQREVEAEMARMTEMRLNAEQEADEDDEEDSTDELS